MRSLVVACVLCHLALAAAAQQPTVPRTREDSVRAAADSAAQARRAAGSQAGQPNPRLLPDISAVGDLVADFSPDGSTQEDGSRLGIREVELALGAAVDPYFRGDVYIGVNDLHGAAVEQAYLTTSALPWSLQVRLGRYLLPLGKLNTTHRHDLHTLEYPHVLQRFLGSEGLKGTGIEVSRIGAPLGFYQELLVSVVDGLTTGHGHGAGHDEEHEEQPGEEHDAELRPPSPANRYLAGLGYTARLRNYWDLGAHTNLELSFSGATGRVPVALDGDVDGYDAVNARRTLLAADLTLRWRPLRQGLYRSFILQAEVLRQFNERDPDIPFDPGQAGLAEPQRDYTGAYVFARWQLSRRTFIGARGDWLEDPELHLEDGHAGGALRAASLYYQFYPSEFSKLLAGIERLMPEGGGGVSRLLLQATFALGPHRPHPF